MFELPPKNICSQLPFQQYEQNCQQVTAIALVNIAAASMQTV
jgi:hypothetical protein